MKILILSFLLVMMNIRCQDHFIGKPVLLVKNRSVDLGEIKFDSSYNLQYEIKNTGDSRLTIDTVTSSCGCSVPSIDKKVLDPSEDGMISVTYKPVDEGRFEKSLVVKSNTDSIYTILKFKGTSIK